MNRDLAHDLRGEKLSPEEFTERAEHIRRLREAIIAWKQEYLPGDLPFDRPRLKELTTFLSTEMRDEVDAITASFLDRDMYPNRPVIKLMAKEIAKMPDVFMFGWRAGDRETKIHDHGDSFVCPSPCTAEK